MSKEVNATATDAVDFTNPEAVAAELAATDAATPAASTATKEKKPAKPRTIKVSFTADHDIKSGENVSFDFELPKADHRGIVAGIALADMTDDQLKIEYRNANSVFYKTTKAGRDASKSKERLDNCKAEMEKRGIQPNARTTQAIDAASVAAMILKGDLSVDDIQKLLDGATTAQN